MLSIPQKFRIFNEKCGARVYAYRFARNRREFLGRSARCDGAVREKLITRGALNRQCSFARVRCAGACTVSPAKKRPHVKTRPHCL